MSSTYQTILSGSVTVGEAGDAVTVHVTGQIGWMGAVLYAVNDTPEAGRNELWRIDDPTSTWAGGPWKATFPSGLTDPQGITSHGGALYVVVHGTGDELWRIDDPTSVRGSAVLGRQHSPPASRSRYGHHVSRRGALRGGRRHGRRIVEDRRPDFSPWVGGPWKATFPSGLTDPRGITSHGGLALRGGQCDGDGIVEDRRPDESPGSAVSKKATFPSGLT